MTNNDALRSIAYLLQISDAKVVEVVALGGGKTTLDDVLAYMKREEEPDHLPLPHKVMAHFLNGLVIFKRGRLEGAPDAPVEVPVTNNLILKKLRVAFELTDDDIATILSKAGLSVSKSERSAFFRRPDHRNYRECGDQVLRNVIRGLTR
jgi:uncharacterized protein YehS (DUF1456 family)